MQQAHCRIRVLIVARYGITVLTIVSCSERSSSMAHTLFILTIVGRGYSECAILRRRKVQPVTRQQCVSTCTPRRHPAVTLKPEDHGDHHDKLAT